MKQHTITTYTYEELSPEAQRRARDWYRECSFGDTFSAECEIDQAKDLGRHLGLDIDHIYYSGFWSQGDGACFEGSWRANRVDPAEIINRTSDAELIRIAEALAKIAERYPDASFHVRQRVHYMHENCTVFVHCFGDDDERRIKVIGGTERDDEDTVEELRRAWEKAYPEDEVEELARDFMRWIYKQLEADYEWRNSDEQVAESIIAIEYEFTEDGKSF